MNKPNKKTVSTAFTFLAVVYTASFLGGWLIYWGFTLLVAQLGYTLPEANLKNSFIIWFIFVCLNIYRSWIKKVQDSN